jgi:hypothetical protein
MSRNIEDFDAYCTECQAVACIHVVEAFADLDPPSYLPMREPLRPRIPGLCPDESRDDK